MKVWNVVSRILQVLLRRMGLGVGQFGVESGSCRVSEIIRIPLAIPQEL